MPATLFDADHKDQGSLFADLAPVAPIHCYADRQAELFTAPADVRRRREQDEEFERMVAELERDRQDFERLTGTKQSADAWMYAATKE